MPVAKISESSMAWLIKKATKLGVSVKDYLDSLVAENKESEGEEEEEEEEESEEESEEEEEEEEA